MLDQFLHYLTVEKGLSENTIEAYHHDLVRFFESSEGERDSKMFRKWIQLNLRAFLLGLKRRGLSTRTVGRNQVVLRTFFRFLVLEGILEANPAEELESPKMIKTLPEILTSREVELLLEQPDLKTPLGIRDRAMLEMLYATGMRVSELIRTSHEPGQPRGRIYPGLWEGIERKGRSFGERSHPMGHPLPRNSSEPSLERKGEPPSFCRSIREGNEPPTVLEKPQRLWPEGRHQEEDDSPSPETLLCEPSFGTGSRSSVRSDDAWPC